MWVDMNDTIGEQQAGFRKDYSTVDHIFTLLAIVQKQQQQKQQQQQQKTVCKP